MATKIERALASRFSKPDRYGDIAAVWYEDGKQVSDTIKVNKNDRDYQYNKMRAAYDALIASAPEANREAIAKMVNAFLADVFSEDAYMLSVVHNLSTQQLVKNLAPYYNNAD